MILYRLLVLGLVPLIFALPTLAQDETERIFWETMDCNDETQVRAYLETFPSGSFVDEAIACLKSNGNRSAISNDLERCSEYLQSNQLTSGSDGNAFQCYQQVLTNNPGNNKALQGLKKIEDIYLSRISSAINKNNLELAISNLGKLRQVNPSHSALAKLESDIVEQRLDEQRKLDQAFWSEVSCDDESQLNEYKQNFPEGIYLDQANRCLQEIRSKYIYGKWRGKGKDFLIPQYIATFRFQPDLITIRADYNENMSCEGQLTPDSPVKDFRTGDTLLLKAKLISGPCFKKAKVKLQWAEKNKLIYSWYKLGIKAGGGELSRIE